MLQEIIVYIILLLVVSIVVWLIVRRLRQKQSCKTGCAGCALADTCNKATKKPIS